MYPDNLAKTIAGKLKRPIHAVYGKAYSFGLKKSKAFFESKKSGRLKKDDGISYRYKKGNIPANKGKKQEEFMTPEAIEKTKATRFKKGHLPHNAKGAPGTITIRNHKGVELKYIKLSRAKWRPLHRHIWLEAKKEIPKGYNLVFKDGNRMNCVLENLECISNKELMARNTIQRYPPELQATFKLISKINKKVKNHEKQEFSS